MQLFKKKSKGFTLVELVVVILVIAILATATFLGGATIIKQSRKSKVQTNLSNYAAYVQDMFYAEPSVVNKTENDVKELLNNKYLTEDFQLGETKDSWDKPYEFYFATNTVDQHKSTYVIISSNGSNGIKESYEVIFDLSAEDHVSAQAALDSDTLMTGDDLGLVVLLRDGAVSSANYGFDKTSAAPTAITMLDGVNQVYNGTAPLVFRSSANFATFQEVRVDGKTVESTNYEVTEGSTIITFADTYARSLANNVHTVEIVSTGGTADTSFSVELNYTVTFDANGGTVATTSKPVTYNNTYGELPVPTRDGFVFNGWYTAATEGSEIEETTIVTTNINHTLFAHWTAGNYTVTFDANGGTVATTSKPVTYNSEYDELPTPTYTGYVFDGWYTAATGGDEVKSSTTVTITTAQTLYAHWTAGSYTVTFNANGGSVTQANKQVTYKGTYGSLPTPTYAGYVFNGWYTATTNGNKVETTTTVSITAAQTLYAHWTIGSYTVTFNANGGTVATTSKQVTYNNAYGELPNPISDEYTFEGWYTSATGGTKVEKNTIVTVGLNHTLYAHWIQAGLYETGTTNLKMTWSQIKDSYPKAFTTANTIVSYVYSSCFESLSGDLVIPSNITSVGIQAFQDCTRLTSIIIPNSVKSIGNYAFDGCTILTSITIPNSVTSIGESAFVGCLGLTSITIPDSVTSIGDYAFSWCEELTSITLSNNLTSIGEQAFANCSKLTSITIPSSVTSIGDYAFKNCHNLTSLTIPSSVKSIGKYAFEYCDKLVSVIFQSGVKSIGEGVFVFCDNLKSVTFPNSITFIGFGTFQNCTVITTVTYLGTKSQWNAITKESWRINSSIRTIVCTDGNVSA